MALVPRKSTALDFFSGSGLVTEGLQPFFDVIWANDNDPAKNATYHANFENEILDNRSIEDIHGWQVPAADLAWGSFPCQDLSLAGNMAGIFHGKRSALFWDWIRILDEMDEKDRPPLLAVENVVGFLIAGDSSDFKLAYKAVRERGYLAGAFVIDAAHFVPQSRPTLSLSACGKT